MGQNTRKQKRLNRTKQLRIERKIIKAETNPEVNQEAEEVLNLHLSDASDFEEENDVSLSFIQQTQCTHNSTSEGLITFQQLPIGSEDVFANIGSSLVEAEELARRKKLIVKEIGTSKDLRTFRKVKIGKNGEKQFSKEEIKIEKETAEFSNSKLGTDSDKNQSSSRNKRRLNSEIDNELVHSVFNSEKNILNCQDISKTESSNLNLLKKVSGSNRPQNNSRKKQKVSCNANSELAHTNSNSEGNKEIFMGVPGINSPNLSQQHTLGDGSALQPHEKEILHKRILNNEVSLPEVIKYQEQIIKTQEHIMNTLEKMTKMLERNCSTTLANQRVLGLLEAKCNNISEVLKASSSLDPSIERSIKNIPSLPATTAEEFQLLENYLLNENNMNKFVCLLKNCGGSSPEVFAKTAMEKIMTNRVGAYFKMEGKHSALSKDASRKMPFSKTKSYEAILASSLLNRETKESNPLEIRDKIKKWLLQAPGRKGGGGRK